MTGPTLPGAYFITGTDTGVGKTVVATGLLAAAAQRGLATIGLKPVAAGCEPRGRDGLLVNDDALALQRAATVELDYAAVNPVALRPAIAPHIAAAEARIAITAASLARHCRDVHARSGAEFAVIEGVGGWFVPLNDDESVADVCVALNTPVVIVVGLRLGCLNHALLTADAVRARGLRIAGWVANVIDADMGALQDNVAALRARLPEPMLGAVPRLGDRADGGEAAGCLDLEVLLGD